MLKFFRKYHKWPALFFTLFILLFAVSGIILNHREQLSGVDISRKFLPANYSWNNWNLAAVKGSVTIPGGRRLVYGNIGVWETDSVFSRFSDFNRGFPPGMDNRKVNTLAWVKGKGLFSGTLFGLFHYDSAVKSWREIDLPVTEKRIVKILAAGDSLLVMTRSSLLWNSLKTPGLGFIQVKVPPATDDDRQTGMFKTLWVIHSGEIYGLAGKLLIDLVGLFFIIICITGLIWFFTPYIVRRHRDRSLSRLKKFNRDSLRLHNWLGSWFLPLLILTTLTGMFLRPPLLIPIANSRVTKIPHSELDSPNPWFDRFRDLVYDSASRRFLVATSEGIYLSDDAFSGPLTPAMVQPPVSVMGINVFEVMANERYRVGSFSGLYEWNLNDGSITDCSTGRSWSGPVKGGPPFGELTVAGYLESAAGQEYLFDYANGAISLNGAPPFPAMPPEMIRNSPISLWSAALEIHTGRIFEPLLGPFYILVVPLTGLVCFFILITGFFSWYIGKRKRKQSTDGSI